MEHMLTKRRKRLRVIFSVLSLVLAACTFFFEGTSHRGLTVLLKAAASAAFCAVPVVCPPADKRKEVVLIFGAAADVLTELHLLFPNALEPTFAAGVLLFAAEYVFLIVILCGKKRPAKKTLVGFAVFWTLIGSCVFRVPKAGFAVKALGTLYLGILLLLCAVSRERAGLGFLYIGSVLILLSDAALICNRFVLTPSVWLGAVNMLLYYSGQLFIAHALSGD